MPSFEQQVENNRIIINARVSRGAGEHWMEVGALLDTGAQLTCISPKVVETLGLAPTGTAGLIPASGERVETFEYYAWVDIPISYYAIRPAQSVPFLMGNQLSVAALPYQPEGYDVILGMDFLGTFHITMYRNRIILSN